MNDSRIEQIWKYLDGELSPEEQVALEDWLKQSPENCDEFARIALLQDRLRTILASGPENQDSDSKARQHQAVRGTVGKRHWELSGWSLALLVLLALFGGVLLLWPDSAGSGLQAAGLELQRLSAWSNQEVSRSFRIQVLVDAPEPPKGKRSRGEAGGNERGGMAFGQGGADAPPKPSLDGALLHTRGRNEFVLERLVSGKRPFFTGSDGVSGWAISPDGPTRLSTDPTRFNRDIPGHEHRLPLNRVFGNLNELESAYRIQLFLAQEGQTEQPPASLLVATKRKGKRGPERIEITFEASTGRIFEMRFIAMPYGPRRLDLDLKLIAEGNLGPEFFKHLAHQAADATEIQEE